MWNQKVYLFNNITGYTKHYFLSSSPQFYRLFVGEHHILLVDLQTKSGD